ncbi:MAG: FliM/FliN family flagellar motor switch protein [Anaeromyxobacter sp.]
MMSDQHPTPVPGGNAPTVHTLAMPELEPAPAGALGAPLLGNEGGRPNPLRNVKVRLAVHVGSVSLTVGELLAAQAHQVLKLDRAVEQPVDLLLDGEVVARGTLLAVDDQFAVRITELPVALHAPLAGTPDAAP